MTFPNARRRLRANVALAALVVALFLLPSVGTGHAATGPGPARAEPIAAASLAPIGPPAATAASATSIRPAVASPTVQSTLVLFNDSLESGNFPAQWATLPYAVAVDTDTGDLFVADEYPAQLSVLHSVPSIGIEVVATIPLMGTPRGVAYDPANDTVYVTDFGYANVLAINGTTLSPTATIPTGGYPTGIVYDDHDGDLYVSNALDDNVTVVNATRNSVVVGGIPLEPSSALGPGPIAFDSGTDQVFVAETLVSSGTSMSVDVIDDSTNAVVANVSVGDQPEGIAYDPNDGEVFVANERSDNLTAISDSTDTTVGNYSGFDLPDGIAYLPAQQELDVSNGGNGSVATFDPASASIRSTTGVGTSPGDIVFADFDGGAYPIVADDGSANVSVLDPAAAYVDYTARVGQTPWGIAYDAAKGELFLANSLAQGSVSVINDSRNTFSPTTAIPVGQDPIGVAVDPDTGEVYVTNSRNDSVSVISDSTDAVVATIGVGGEPWGVTYDPTDHEIWVVNSYTDNVSAIDPTTHSVVASVSITGDAAGEGIAYDAARGTLYVTEADYEQVALIDAANRTFVATLGAGVGEKSAVYDAADQLVYVSNEDSDNVTVYAQTNATNAHVVANITVPNDPYGLAYDAALDEVFVTESTMDGLAVIQPSNESVVANVTVGLDPVAVALDPAHATLYVDDQEEGATTILGLGGGNSTPTQAFEESGLPSGATWYINVSGQSPLAATVNGPAGTAITASLASGAYTYTAATSWTNWTTSAGGGFTVSPTGNAAIDVPFSPVTFAIRANESGLPEGSTWYFNVSGGPSDSVVVAAGNWVAWSFVLPNGTYAWSTATNWANYTARTPTGTFTVDGAGTLVNVTFGPTPRIDYAITFTESGLPVGTTWYVNVTGGSSGFATVASGVGTSIVLQLPDGVHTFAASSNGASWAWNQTVGGDSVTVDGAAKIVQVAFQSTTTYTVEFTETGIPAGDRFTVLVGGRDLSALAPTTLNTPLANGTYPFTVGTVEGYTANVTSGSVVVRGHATTVDVSFAAATSTHPSGSNTPFPWTWVGVGVLLALVVFFLILLAWRRRKKEPPPASTAPTPAAPPPTSGSGGAA